jgi:glycosyltransferase involved in cell wall biosynthesis
MKLSVVIPCYNAVDTIGFQLAALSRQRWGEPWEVIVADNGSTDHSMQMVNRYKNQFKHLTIVDASDKKGAAHARNKGVEHSSGEYIAFCDADDIVDSKWLPAIGKAFEEHDFVACKRNWRTLNNFSEHTLQSKVQTDGLIDFSLGKFLQHGGGGSLGIKKSIHYEVNGMNEALPCLEDLEYCWRVQLAGHNLTYIPEAVINSRAKNDLRKIFMQELQWSEYDIYMHKKYESYSGMPAFSLYNTFRSLYHELRALRWLLSDKKRELWVIRLALQLGRLKGYSKYKLYEYGINNSRLKNIIG